MCAIVFMYCMSMLYGSEGMKKLLSIVAVIVLVIIGIFGVYRATKSEKKYYATLDINSQIEFVLNDKYEVNKVIALNEDASIVLHGLNLTDLSLEDAARVVIIETIRLGYIDELGTENHISVTAYNNDEEVNKTIEEKIINKVKSILDKENISYDVIAIEVNDELKRIANEKKISYGKMLLVEKAYSLNNSLDKEKLMKLSIKEIQNKINLSVDERIKEKGGDSEQYHQELKNRKEGKMKQNRNRINNIINDILENNKELLDSLSGVEREEMIKKLINDEKNNMGNRPKSSHGIRN